MFAFETVLAENVEIVVEDLQVFSLRVEFDEAVVVKAVDVG